MLINCGNVKGVPSDALAEKDISGGENLGGVAGVNMVDNTREKVNEAFKSKLEMLFNDPGMFSTSK